MYCINCGNQLNEGQAFCDKCGVMASGEGGPTPVYVISAPKKSAALAAVLSFMLPGGGQMYAEKMGRGLALLLSSIVIVVFGALISVVAMAPGSRGGNSGIPVVILAIAFILAFWIWNVYDAYKQANKYNDMRFH